MEIAETTIFTREITRILLDDEYRELQTFLVEVYDGRFYV